MVGPNVLVLLALAIGARIQHIDAQSVFLDVLDLPLAADFATYYAEGVRKLAGGRFCLPPCSPNTNDQFVESKKPEPLSDSSLLWNFTAFPAMTPRLSGLYRCFTSTAQSRRTYTLHAPEEFPTPMTPVPTTTSVTYVVPISSGMPQYLEGSGTRIWILMLLFAAIVICESRRSMDSQPRHISMEKYTLHLLVAMLIVNLPHYGHCQPCNNSDFTVGLHCLVGQQADGNYKLFFASGQETDILQLTESLPKCLLKTPCPVPPLLTLENNDTMQIVFKSQQSNLSLEWDATEMPHLNPNHTGVYRCNARSKSSLRMYNLTVVVPSSISCTRPRYLPECEVSVSCTVYGFPKPTVLWQGHTVPTITTSKTSHQHGVYEYNSTAVFQLPDNLIDNTSVSISLKVFHDPPISCTVVARDSSIQERCNNASRNITESICFEVSYGNRTIENDTCADDVLTSGPITTPSPSPGPTSHGMSQSTTNLQGNTGTTDDSVPTWVIPVAVVGGIALIVIVIVLCLVKSKKCRKTPDTEPPPQASPKSKAAAETEDQYDTFVRNDGRQPQQVADPSADPDHYDTFHHPDQQEPGTAPSARPDTVDHIVLNKSIPAEGETYDHLDREQVQAIKQGQQPGQQSAAATALSTQQPANPRVDTSYSMVDMSKKSSRPLLV